MPGIKPRIQTALDRVLSSGQALSSADLMRVIYCDRRSVQRLLTAMHREGKVHIAGWGKAGASYRHLPQYRLGAGVDAPLPAGVGRLSTPRVRRFRERVSADDAEFLNQRRKQLRAVVKRDPLVAAFFGKK